MVAPSLEEVESKKKMNRESAPFKEALLREAELRKQWLEELKQQQKLNRQKEKEKKRKVEANTDLKPSDVEPMKEESSSAKLRTEPMPPYFNLEELENNNAHSIQAIRGPRLANSILFQSFGLTNGLTEEKDIPEGLPKQKQKKQEEKEEDEDMNSDQESVDAEVDEKASNTFPAEETWVAQPEESVPGNQSARSFILDKVTEEDDVYVFRTDYV
ncbi:Guanine nucleotide-binding protein-like 3 [Tupaia chinensis]|uniref:Guanine nucleotide-binding protein-like 3 n=1 Tax=Tupaia chinensis TaxID=246437 RepID=L9L4A8_TUPCH|nr:Guanine nucleotide-binding protein-like 3 [Tupaia chinensis]